MSLHGGGDAGQQWKGTTSMRLQDGAIPLLWQRLIVIDAAQSVLRFILAYICEGAEFGLYKLGPEGPSRQLG